MDDNQIMLDHMVESKACLEMEANNTQYFEMEANNTKHLLFIDQMYSQSFYSLDN